MVKRSVANTAAASVEETTAPSRNDSSHERSKSTCAADTGEQRAHDDADRAQQRGRHGDLAQPPPRRLQAALVEDQREADGSDLAGELRVVELDAAGPVRAEQHPEPEERDQHGKPVRAAPSATTTLAAQDGADQEQHQAFVHGYIFAARNAEHIRASGSSQEADRAGLLLLPVKCAQALPPGKGRLACASVPGFLGRPAPLRRLVGANASLYCT